MARATKTSAEVKVTLELSEEEAQVLLSTLNMVDSDDDEAGAALGDIYRALAPTCGWHCKFYVKSPNGRGAKLVRREGGGS